eukprot:TRINITY_DN716_c0_g1_i1.p1 TRINITY_DN716_c0_g1~~TRINITY_DN716_c0_g1_i1.p1  ORF type:complete len:164 (-),score=20.58 TRINITY_DN716_c0_g1_i1:1513-2004(-)
MVALRALLEHGDNSNDDNSATTFNTTTNSHDSGNGSNDNLNSNSGYYSCWSTDSHGGNDCWWHWPALFFVLFVFLFIIAMIVLCIRRQRRWASNDVVVYASGAELPLQQIYPVPKQAQNPVLVNQYYLQHHQQQQQQQQVPFSGYPYDNEGMHTGMQGQPVKY